MEHAMNPATKDGMILLQLRRPQLSKSLKGCITAATERQSLNVQNTYSRENQICFCVPAILILELNSLLGQNYRKSASSAYIQVYRQPVSRTVFSVQELLSKSEHQFNSKQYAGIRRARKVTWEN